MELLNAFDNPLPRTTSGGLARTRRRRIAAAGVLVLIVLGAWGHWR